MNPDETERQIVEKRTGRALPPRSEIEGIGLSGRNRAGDEVIRLHMALFADHDNQEPAPLGLLLMPDLLVSLRYAESQVIDDAARTLHEDGPPTGVGALLALVQTLVEHTASRMQAVADEMVHLSDRLFVRTRLRTQRLRALMIEVGRLEGRLTRVRASLLGVNRLLVFVCEREVAWIDDAARQQLRIVSSDVRALDDFDEQLTDKLQFLLDAILGFISTVQNDVMKLLTVVSVATIPPLLLVGVWGMNFKHMPELEKPWGYPMALTAIVLSTLIPLLVFGLRGWLASTWTGRCRGRDPSGTKPTRRLPQRDPPTKRGGIGCGPVFRIPPYAYQTSRNSFLMGIFPRHCADAQLRFDRAWAGVYGVPGRERLLSESGGRRSESDQWVPGARGAVCELPFA